MISTESRPADGGTVAARAGVIGYGALGYLAFLAAALYAIGFLADAVVPRAVDSGGPESGTAAAVAIDAALLGLFAVQHSVMARPRFKRRFNRIFPPAVERSTYVLAASAVLGLLFWQWRPIDDVVWDVENIAGEIVLWSLYGIGWFLVVLSTFLIDHFEMFGLRQVAARVHGRRHEPPGFVTPLLYRFVRHPMMLGFLVAFWATPTMTVGHLLFAALASGYIVVAVRIEERDLMRQLPEYQDYMERTPRFIPQPSTDGG